MKKISVVLCLVVLCITTMCAQSLPPGTKPLSSFTVVLDYTIDPWSDIENSKEVSYLPVDSSSTKYGQFMPATAAFSTFRNLLSNHAIYPNGKLCGMASGSVYWFDPKKNSFELLFILDSEITNLSMTADSNLIAASTRNACYLWRRSSPKELKQITSSTLNSGKGRLYALTLNPQGTKAIASLIDGNENESWSLHYLLDMTSMEILNKLPSYSASGFSPDGNKVVYREYDYEHEGNSEKRYVGFLFLSFDGKKIARFRIPETEHRRNEDQSDPKYFTDFAYATPGDFTHWHWWNIGWNEYGLSILTERSDYSSSGIHFYEYRVTNEKKGGPDLLKYIPEYAIHNANYKLGFTKRPDEESLGQFILREDETHKKTIWKRRVLMHYDNTYMEYVDPIQNVVVIPMTKERPSDAALTGTMQYQYLAFYDWSTGKKIRADFPLKDYYMRDVVFVGPELEYVVFDANGGGGDILWLKEGRLKSWDGTKTYLGEGIREFKPSFDGSVSYQWEGKDYFISPAEGQIGSPVQIAVRPDQNILAIVDEAFQFFLFERDNGTVLFRGKIVLKGSIVGLEENIPNQEAILSLKSRAPLSNTANNPLHIETVNVSVAQGYQEMEY